MNVKSFWIIVSVVAASLIMLPQSGVLAGERLSARDVSVLAGHDQGANDGAFEAVLSADRPQSESSTPNPDALDGSRLAEESNKGSAPAQVPDEVGTLKTRIIELQNKGKLGFRRIIPCRSVEGFGSYSRIEPGQPLSKVVFYCEPFNVSTLVSGDRYIIDCTVDVFLMGPAGNVLFGKENLLKINKVSWSPILDLYFNVEINLKKPVSGTMFIKIALHDRIKNQSVSATQRINIEAGAPKKDDKI